MWKSFLVENEIYLLRAERIGDNYEVYLTDLEKLWSYNVAEKTIIDTFQRCNPVIDIKPEDCLTRTLKMFKEVDHGESLLNFEDSSVKLQIKTTLPDFKFKIKYEMELTKCESDMFTKFVTISLIQTVSLLEKQQKMICNLLHMKDRELEEYRMEKGEITRTDLMTDEFKPETIVFSSNQLMLNVFEKYAHKLVEKYGVIEEQVREVEMETWNNLSRKRRIYNKETAEKTKAAKIIYKGKH